MKRVIETVITTTTITTINIIVNTPIEELSLASLLDGVDTTCPFSLVKLNFLLKLVN
jgi:hypothetical protein